MKTTFAKSFVRDLKKIKSKDDLSAVAKAIEQVEKADAQSEIEELKKLRGFKHYFRIRVGNLRIGISIEHGIVAFIRCLDRKSIYRHFPE